MALVHEYLYQNIDLSTIKVDVYISSLVDEIKSSYDISNKINFEVDVISESFDLDTLIPLGLIVNELLTNSIKYAFPNNKIDLNKENLIRISLMKDQEQYLLSVSDNGVGFDSSIVSKGIGRELINSLVQQIDGVYESVQDNGVTINIYFKI